MLTVIATARSLRNFPPGLKHAHQLSAEMAPVKAAAAAVLAAVNTVRAAPAQLCSALSSVLPPIQQILPGGRAQYRALRRAQEPSQRRRPRSATRYAACSLVASACGGCVDEALSNVLYKLLSAAHDYSAHADLASALATPAAIKTEAAAMLGNLTAGPVPTGPAPMLGGAAAGLCSLVGLAAARPVDAASAGFANAFAAPALSMQACSLPLAALTLSLLEGDAPRVSIRTLTSRQYVEEFLPADAYFDAAQLLLRESPLPESATLCDTAPAPSCTAPGSPSSPPAHQVRGGSDRAPQPPRPRQALRGPPAPSRVRGTHSSVPQQAAAPPSLAVPQRARADGSQQFERTLTLSWKRTAARTRLTMVAAAAATPAAAVSTAAVSTAAVSTAAPRPLPLSPSRFLPPAAYHPLPAPPPRRAPCGDALARRQCLLPRRYYLRPLRGPGGEGCSLHASLPRCRPILWLGIWTVQPGGSSRITSCCWACGCFQCRPAHGCGQRRRRQCAGRGRGSR